MVAPVADTEQDSAATAQLQERILALADSSQSLPSGQRRRLRDLALALDGGAAATKWATVDLQRVLDAERIAAHQAADAAPPAWLRGLELVRNLLVLAPVGWTWYGISVASNAYQQTLTADPNLGPLPFLLLWQRGFYGRLNWLPFSRMAIIDAGMVAIIIALTLAMHLLFERVESRQARDLAAARRQIDDLLADATLALAEHNGGQQRRFLGDFATIGDRLLQQLALERERLSVLAAQRDREVSELTAFAAGLVAGANGLLEAAHNFAGMYQSLTESMRSLAGTVAALTAGQRELLERAGSIGGLLQNWTSEAAQLSTALRQALDGVNNATGGIARGAASFTASAGRLATELPAALREIEEGVRPLPAAAGSFAAAASGLSQSVGALQASVDASVVTQRNVAAAEVAVSESFADVLKEQRVLSGGLRDTLAAVSSVGTQVVAGVSALTAAAKAAEQSAAGFAERSEAASLALRQRTLELLNAQQTLHEKLLQEQAGRDTTSAGLVASQQAFLAAVAAERVAQQALADSVAQSAIAAVTTLQAVHDEATTLNALAINLDDLARSLPAYVQQLRAEFNDVATTQATSAQQLAATGRSAEESARSIATFTDGWGAAMGDLTAQSAALSAALAALSGAPPRYAGNGPDSAAQARS